MVHIEELGTDAFEGEIEERVYDYEKHNDRGIVSYVCMNLGGGIDLLKCME
jgi:hypothetical protein